MGATVGTGRPDRAAAPSTRALLICGVIAGPLFVATLIVQGATRANYDPLRHPGSSLALGDLGWIQEINFIVAGLFTLAFALGLRRVLRPHKGATWGPLLIAVWAVGLLGAGIFVTDPVSGYPPGTPNQLEQPSMHGALHDLFSIPGFIALLAACLVLAHRFAAQAEHGWAIYSAATGAVFAASFVLASAAFSQTEPFVDLGGLFQRITAAVGFGWLTALAIHLLTTPSQPPSETPTDTRPRNRRQKPNTPPGVPPPNS